MNKLFFLTTSSLTVLALNAPANDFTYCHASDGKTYRISAHVLNNDSDDTHQVFLALMNPNGQTTGVQLLGTFEAVSPTKFVNAWENGEEILFSAPPFKNTRLKTVSAMDIVDAEGAKHVECVATH